MKRVQVEGEKQAHRVQEGGKRSWSVVQETVADMNFQQTLITDMMLLI